MESDVLKDRQLEIGEGSFPSYLVGFILSIALTLVAYYLVVGEVFEPKSLQLAIALLGIIQMVIQVVFFLHLGNESSPRWNLLLFIFMSLVVVTVVFGSLWIMNHLNENLMQMVPHD